MTNEEYWKKRFEYLEKVQIENENKYTSKLIREYERAITDIQKEIRQWYARFAKNNSIALAEAKKLLEANELKELKWNVEEYIKRGQENGIDQIWKKELENASAKVHISRLDGLMLELQEQIEELYGKQEEDLSEFIINGYKDTYYSSAYEIHKGCNVAFGLKPLDNVLINKLIVKPWAVDGLNFSDRLWKNKKVLINTLQSDLTQSIIRGEAPDKVIDKISKLFNTDKNKAGRLVMTESAFFSSVARKDCFNDLGVKKYKIVATLDSRTSEICRNLDGQVYDMKDYKSGSTAPPFHVWCRSTTAPYFEDEFEFGERAARNEDGKTYYIPGNITYKEWKEKFVDNKQENGLKKDK